MRNLPDPCLMLLTDRRRLPAGMPLAQAVGPAVTGGVNLVVLAENDLPATPRTTIAGFVRDSIRRRAPYLISGDVALARAAMADGVHRDTATPDLAAIRAELGPDGLLGVRAVNVEEVRSAQTVGADYVLVEIDWSGGETALHTLKTFVQRVNIPIIAGTDMPLEYIAGIVQAGARGVALCEPAMAAYDRTRACRTYREALDTALQSLS